MGTVRARVGVHASTCARLRARDSWSDARVEAFGTDWQQGTAKRRALDSVPRVCARAAHVRRRVQQRGLPGRGGETPGRGTEGTSELSKGKQIEKIISK